MTENQNRPREYDAVLGGNNPPPVNAAVLGGIEGVKRRLTFPDELVRVGAVKDTIKYGEAGLDLAIASLKDKSPQVRHAVLNLLQEKLTHPKVKTLLGKELKLVNNTLIKIYQEKFETVTVNARGEIIKRELAQAEIFVEDLGGGVKLEMVSIPGGSFLMGSPENE
ncbi:MAG: formylglycine-generating enzyme family protein, partial [Okeania sp. SIO2H7]|nr:formylglycine-generating enzyme family protein [Okeania sp. SIO2H7]